MNKEEKIIENIASFSLNNGLKVIVSPNNAHPVISLQLYVRTGSCNEGEEEAGYSHFLEHLVFKSTEKYPANALTEKAMFLGSNLNAYTEFDSTCFYLTLSSRFTSEALDILSQLFAYANFSEQDFAFEKNVVLEEIAYYENDPEDYFIEQVPALYFEKSPYRKPIIGTKESIKEATCDKLNIFYRKQYTPSNAFLIVSGDCCLDKLKEELDSFFGPSESAHDQAEPISNAVPETVYPAKLIVKGVNRKVSKPQIAFVLPEVSGKQRQAHTLDLATRIFANGKKSRLYKKLFIEKKLIDQIRVDSYSGINDGSALFVMTPAKENYIEEIVSIFREELIAMNRITSDEIEEVKTEMKHSHRYSLEYAKSIGFSLGVEEVLGDYSNFAKYIEIIDGINESEVNEVIKSYLAPERLGIFMLAPQEQNKKYLPLMAEVMTAKQEVSLREAALSASRTVEKYENFRSVMLSNGCKLLMKKVSGKPTIGITAAFRSSQLNESPELRGINYLTSVLLLYGNEKRSYQQMLDFTSHLGIQISISADDEVTLIKIKCFAERLETSLQLLADIIYTPLFPTEHFLNIRRLAMSNMGRIKDYPSQYATYLWKKQVFGSTSNLLDREGTKTSLQYLSRKKILNWFREHYRSNQMSLAIVGDFPFEYALELGERIIAGHQAANKNLAESARNSNFPPEQENSVSDIKFRKSISSVNNGGIVHIGGFCCTSQETRKNTTFHLISQIMGGDINSRLYDELREKRGLAYNVGFAVNTMQHIGLYAAYAIVDKKAVRQTISLIQKCFESLIKGDVREEELTIAKNSIRGQRLRSEESVGLQATTLASLDCLGYDYNYYLSREERLQQVTLDDVQQTAEEYMKTQDLYIHILV